MKTKSIFSYRKILAHLRDYSRLNDLMEQEKILPNCPDHDLREALVKWITALADDYYRMFRQIYTDLPESIPEEIKINFQFLSSTALYSRMSNLYFKEFGLLRPSTDHSLYFEDTLKIDLNFLIKDDSQKIDPDFKKEFPYASEAIRKTFERSRTTATKQLGRLRGLPISALGAKQVFDHQLKHQLIIPSGLTPSDCNNLARFDDYKVIKQIVRKLSLCKGPDIEGSASYWTNQFLIWAELPLPTKEAKDFYEQTKKYKLSEYLKSDSKIKFGPKFWQGDLFKRLKKKLLNASSDPKSEIRNLSLYSDADANALVLRININFINLFRLRRSPRIRKLFVNTIRVIIANYIA